MYFDNNNLVMFEKYDIRDNFIAYFDILGYKDKLNSDKDNNGANLLNIISDIINFSEILVSYNTKSESKTEIKMRALSDSYIFSTETDYVSLMLMVGGIQAASIFNDIFIRGSLCYGSLFLNEKIAFGQGLVEAYKLESKLAVFPRLIIDDSFFSGIVYKDSEIYKRDVTIKEVEYSLKKLICNDFDQYKFIDYLEIMKNYKEKEINIYPDNKNAFDKFLNDHAKYIKLNLQNENKRIVQKYHWCKNYHNEFCKKYKYLDLII